MRLGFFEFVNIDATLSSISIPYRGAEIETGPISVTKANPRERGTSPISILDYETGSAVVSWPVSISCPLFERVGIPPMELVFTGVGETDSDRRDTLFFDSAEFDIPAIPLPNGDIVAPKRVIAGNTNDSRTVIIIAVPDPSLPNPFSGDTPGTFDTLTQEVLDRHPISAMMDQSFRMNRIQIDDRVKRRMMEASRREGQELQFYFPDDDLLRGSRLEGGFGMRSVETPEFLRSP